MTDAAPHAPPPGSPPGSPRTHSRPGTRPWIGWRLAALFYDLWPVVAMWFALSFLFALAHTFMGHHDPRENIAPFSALQWLLWAACWGVTGLYAVVSWSRGGQTLGMRPWRLRVVGPDGGLAGRGALWVRYAAGTLSLLAGGLGFWWAWIDRDRLTWHDRLSGTRVVRDPKA